MADLRQALRCDFDHPKKKPEQPQLVAEPMAHGDDLKGCQGISTMWLTHLTQLLLVVRTVATMVVLGLTTLFIIKTLIYAQRLAFTTVDTVNTGAQATAVFIGILYVQKVAAQFAPLCANFPFLLQLVMCLLPGQDIADPQPIEMTAHTPGTFSDQVFAGSLTAMTCLFGIFLRR